MQTYTHEFLDFAITKGVLRFGEFTLKSGRVSPYFFNSGLFNDGESLLRLGRYYAQAILDQGIDFDMLYGPAYKGIPLVAAVAIAFSDRHGRNVPYAFNRKEAKDHGEGGTIVGAPLQGRVLIVDDVISAGTSVRESVELIKQHSAKPVAVAISLDRQERGKGERSAIEEVEADYQLTVARIATLSDLLTHLQNKPDYGEELSRVAAYREQYGVQR